MLNTVLLILTLTQGGDVSMALSRSETAEKCQSSREAVKGILMTTGATVLVAQCGETPLQLTPYMHGTPPEASRYRYQVTVTADFFEITFLQKEAPCTPATEATPAIYCAISAQRPIDKPS